MSALPIGRSVTARVRALLILVALVAALGGAAAVAAAPASAATSEDYFYISSLGPTYGTGDYFGEFGAGPNGIATDSAGNVYVTIPRGFVKFWASGTVACAYTGDNDYTAGASYGLDVDSNGNVYYADRTNHLIAKLHPDNNGVNGTVYRWVSLTGKDGSGTPLVYGDGGDLNIGTGNGEFNFPSDVAVDGHYLWVTDMLNHRIQKFETATGDNTLSYVGKWGKNGGDGTSGAGNGEFNKPRAIDAQSGTDGHVFVVEELGRRVQEFTKNGVFFGKFGSTTAADPLYLLSPTGIDVDAQGDVYVTDLETTTSWVGKFRSSGGAWSRVTRIGGYGTGNAQFTFPWTSVVDPNGCLWVTDTQNNKVKKFARDATAPTVTPAGWPSGWTKTIGDPELLASDPTVAGQYTSNGVSIWYSNTGGAPWSSYMEPFFSGDFVEGDNTLTYWAEDAVGNQSSPSTVHVYYDKTAPVTTVSGVPAGWSKTPVSATFSPDDTPSGVASTEYSIDGGSSWAPGLSAAITRQGVTTLLVRSIDVAGNVEDPKAVTVRLDSVRPVPKALANKSVKRNAKVKLPYKIVDVPGAQATVTIKIYKGSAFKKTLKVGTKAANAGLTYSYKCKLPKGKYSWKVYATDAAGNAQAKPGVRTLTVK